MTVPGPTFVAGGDIMLGEHPVMVGRGVLTAIRDEPDYDPFAGIRPVLAEADLAFGNLECALRDLPPGTPVDRRDCLGPARGLPLLVDAGFDVLNVANNHSEQHGAAALAETVDALERAGVAVVGLGAPAPGRCRPADVERGGVPLRILGYSLRPRQHFTRRPSYAEGDEAGMLADVGEGAAAGRVVVVSLHWGDEFVVRPSRAQVRLGRALVDAGASLVIGHHPHVLQGWETYRHGAIVYSLGNLVFDMPWHRSLRETALFRCRFADGAVRDPEWIPLLLDGRHVPRPAPAADAAAIAAFLDRARRDLEAGDGPLAAPGDDEYAGLVRRGLAGNRAASYGYFLRNLWRYEPAVVRTIVGKFLLRRLGILKD